MAMCTECRAADQADRGRRKQGRHHAAPGAAARKHVRSRRSRRSLLVIGASGTHEVDASIPGVQVLRSDPSERQAAMMSGGEAHMRALSEAASSTSGAVLGMLIFTSICYTIFFMGITAACCFGGNMFSAGEGVMLRAPPEKDQVVAMLDETWKKQFVRKVYVILGIQIFSTVVISSVMMLVGGAPLVEWVLTKGMLQCHLSSLKQPLAQPCVVRPTEAVTVHSMNPPYALFNTDVFQVTGPFG
eukprot:6200971-Pleurochrysis_carterae.AAC.1